MRFSPRLYATPAAMNPQEKRRFFRIPVNRNITVRAASHDEVRTRMINLCCSGVCVMLNARVRMGEKFKVFFTLPAKDGVRRISAHCVSRNVILRGDHFIVGMEFLKISTAHVNIIDDYIKRVASIRQTP